MSSERELDVKAQKQIVAEYLADPKNTVVRHALSRGPVGLAVFEPIASTGTPMSFSLEVKTMPVTNQKSSGRCWIFAALNLLRESVAKKMAIPPQFELSQNFISLYDKIEKANFALESIIDLIDFSPNERVFTHILDCPVSDGGQWDMFANLVRKYGLMPKDCFPETYQSNNTRETNFLINAIIRDFAHKARELVKKEKKPEIRPLKDETMKTIYRICFDAFGVPPKEFVFEYRDNKDKYHQETFTPLSFFEKFVGKEIDEYQSLINSPTKDKPYNRNFTVDYLGNVYEGKPINHLNLEMEQLKAAILKQLEDGEPVWFGSDVSFYRDRDTNAWDDQAFDYVSAFGAGIAFEKEAMLDFRHSAMNHAMLITGVNLVDGKPTRWKIENSWGDGVGTKGYFVMSASWFDTFVYQAVVRTKYLTKAQQSAAKKVAIHLDPWDPMGTLAD